MKDKKAESQTNKTLKKNKCLSSCLKNYFYICMRTKKVPQKKAFLLFLFEMRNCNSFEF